MYKDPEKQKQANRLAAQRRRDKAKGMTESNTQGMTPDEGMTGPVQSRSQATGEAGEPKSDDKTIFQDLTDDQPITRAEVIEHIIIEGSKVYGRQAVRYLALVFEPWDTRPQPDDPNDMPHSGGRGVYTRVDGSTYQIDATGTAHDRNADGEVYAGTDYKGVA